MAGFARGRAGNLHIVRVLSALIHSGIIRAQLILVLAKVFSPVPLLTRTNPFDVLNAVLNCLANLSLEVDLSR